MFLTRDEVRKLTGRAHRAAQIDVLRANRIPFFVNASGWPIVTKAAIEGRSTMDSPRRRWSPDNGSPQHPS
jgi:hypothetical protein